MTSVDQRSDAFICDGQRTKCLIALAALTSLTHRRPSVIWSERLVIFCVCTGFDVALAVEVGFSTNSATGTGSLLLRAANISVAVSVVLDDAERDQLATCADCIHRDGLAKRFHARSVIRGYTSSTVHFLTDICTCKPAIATAGAVFAPPLDRMTVLNA